ncbi:MAG: DUF4097 family beta strand repeat-containing protein [Xanthomonadales bacterium]
MTWRLGAGFAFALLLLPGGAIAGETVDTTLAMPADGLVRVENLAGLVELSAWDRAEAQVRGETGDSVEEIIIRETANGILVEVRNRKNERTVDNTELYLRIPAGARIEAEGVSSDFRVRGNRGEAIDLRTVSGDLEVEAETDRLELHSVSGDVEFVGRAGRTAVEAVSGDVTLSGSAGEVKVSTVSGDLTLEGGEISRGQFESVSGELRLELSLADEGRLSCDSMSGDVEIRLPAAQEAAFSAQSYSGNIRSDFGDVARASRGPGSSLDTQIGDNGARVRVETFSGDVAIRAR